MSVTSLSFTFVNQYAPQAARPAAPVQARAPAEESPSGACRDHRPASRQNRLVEAMMSALRELGVGGAATTASPASTAGAATSVAGAPAGSTTSASTAEPAASATAAATAEPASPSTTPATTPVSIESAVLQFAHELFSALRSAGQGDSSERSVGRVGGEGGRRHANGNREWRREGYNDMSQRLEALSQRVAAPVPTSPVSSSISITLTVQSGLALPSAASPIGAVAPQVPGVPADAEMPNPAAAAPVATAPAAPAPVASSLAQNPLLEAFSQLFNALKPQASSAAPGNIADTLRTFLRTLAEAMRPETSGGAQTLQVGGLVNVTA